MDGVGSADQVASHPAHLFGLRGDLGVEIAAVVEVLLDLSGGMDGGVRVVVFRFLAKVPIDPFPKATLLVLGDVVEPEWQTEGVDGPDGLLLDVAAEVGFPKLHRAVLDDHFVPVKQIGSFRDETPDGVAR